MLMDFAAYIGFLILICIGLAKSADLVQSTLVYISKRLHINQFIIGFVVLSIASSTPEAMLMFTSAGSQQQTLSAGNLLGGTVILLSLIVGINALKFKGLPFRGSFGLSQLYMALLVVLGGLVTLLDGGVTTVEGIILVVMYTLYVIYLTRHQIVREVVQPSPRTTVFNRRELFRSLIRAGIGLLFLLLLARLAVDVAVKAGELIEIPKSIIGLLILALGTNLPELTIAIRGTGKTENLTVGNALGSATVNIAILGVLGIISPFRIENGSLFPAILLLSMLVLYLALAATTGRTLQRKEAIFLIGFYLTMILVEVLLIAV